MNGFFAPPVRYIKAPNWIISINKNNKADLSVDFFIKKIVQILIFKKYY